MRLIVRRSMEDLGVLGIFGGDLNEDGESNVNTLGKAVRCGRGGEVGILA